MDYEVESMGKIFLCAEMAGAGMFSPSALKIAETGIRNLLVHFGLRPGEIQTRESQGQPPPITMEIPAMDYYSLAPSSGIFEPFFELGEWIKSIEHLGQVHSLEHIFEEPSLISAQRSGRIIISRAPGRVEVGDCLAVVARQSDGLGDPL